MRSLKELLENNDKAWVYCATKELQEAFLKQAGKEGFHTEGIALHHVYGIGRDLHVGCLSTFIWHLSFHTGSTGFPKIDYRAFIEGKEDYECRESHVRRIKCNP